MNNIIVFGSTGKIGAYLLDYLMSNIDNNKYNVIAVGRRERYPYTFYNGQYIQMDVLNSADYKKLPKTDVYSVIDLVGALPARLESNDSNVYIDVNIKGTLNILEYCKRTGADRILFTQTWADLNGYLKDGKPLKPYLERKPIFVGDHSVYVVTKNAAVDLIECYHQTYNLKSFIFRLPNIYMYFPEKYYYVNGEKRYISYRYIIDRAIEGKDIELWGNENAGKDIVYVKDLCQMMFKSLFVEKSSGIYNVGTGVKTTMKEQIEGIIKVFSPPDKPSKIVYKPEKNSCDDFVMDISNAIDDLGYSPKYDYISYLKDYKKEMNLKRFDK